MTNETRQQFASFDEVLTAYDAASNGDARLKGLYRLDDYYSIFDEFVKLFADGSNEVDPDVGRLVRLTKDRLKDLHWWGGRFALANPRDPASGSVAVEVPAPCTVELGAKLEKRALLVISNSYYYRPRNCVTHPDPVKFAETCRKLFPVAKDVPQFAESIRRSIANALAEAGVKDAKYAPTMGWFFSPRSGRCGKTFFVNMLAEVLRDDFGLAVTQTNYSPNWTNPQDYKAQMILWTEVGDLYEDNKARINLFVDHDKFKYNIKYGGEGNFSARGSYAATSNFFPPGILDNPGRYRIAEWLPLSYNDRPDEIISKYYPGEGEYRALVFDLVDSCPLNTACSASLRSDVFSAKEFFEYSNRQDLFREARASGKLVVKSQYRQAVCDMVDRMGNDFHAFDRPMRVNKFFEGVDISDGERRIRINRLLSFVNYLQAENTGVVKRGKTEDNVRMFNFANILSQIDTSFMTDSEVVDEAYVRKQWDLFVSYARQKFGPKNNAPVPPTPPKKDEETDEIVVNEAPASAEADPLDLVAEEDAIVLNEAPEVAVEAIPQTAEEAFDDASEDDENPDEYFDQGLMSALCEAHALMPCATVTSPVTPKDVHNADTWVKSPRQEFVVAAECVNVEKRGSLEVYDRKRANCRPSAFVFESDSLSVEDQMANLKPEMKKHTLWGVFSGKKSVHILVPIPADLRDAVNDPVIYKAVWKAVGSRLFDKADTLDEACASIARLTRMPWAKRDGNGKVQKMLWVNTTPAPLAWLPEVVAFAKSERDGQKLLDESRRSVARANAARNATRFGNGEHTRETELKHLEACQAKHPTEVKALAIESIKSGVVPAGSNMVGALCALKWVNDAGQMPFEILAREFYDLARTQHPTNIGQPYEYYGFNG